MNQENDELVSVPKEQLEFLVLKSNIELIQKLDKLLKVIEKYEKKMMSVIKNVND